MENKRNQNDSQRRLRNVYKFLPYIVLTVMLASSMIPLISMLGSSFRSRETFMTTRSILPNDWSLFYYERVLSDQRIINYFRNSFLVAFVVSFATAAFSVLGGYSLARFKGRVKGIRFFIIFILMIQMFPTIQMIIPLYLTFNSLGVINKFYTLMLAYPAFTLPMNLMMMQSFIEGVPYEMEEAGLIDGCTRMQTIVKLVLPVSMPGVASSLILAFNHCWNEFLMAMLLTKSDIYRTIPTGLHNYMQEHNSDWGSILAASTLMIIPVLLFLNVLQKNIVNGLTLGSVKG
jgi:ABC-type glycerol-3-phosphate transport system permease component